MCRSAPFLGGNRYYVVALSAVANVVALEDVALPKKSKVIGQSNIQSDGAQNVMRHNGKTVPFQDFYQQKPMDMKSEAMAYVVVQQATEAINTAQKQMEQITETAAESFAKERIAAEAVAHNATEVWGTIAQNVKSNVLGLKPKVEHLSPKADDMLKLAANSELVTKWLFTAAADMKNHVESTKTHLEDIVETSRGLTKRATDAIQRVSAEIHKRTDQDISRISQGNGDPNPINLIKSQMQALDAASGKNLQQVAAVGRQTEKDITEIASKSGSTGDGLVSRMTQDAQRRKEAVQDATAALAKESADAMMKSWSVSPSGGGSAHATYSSSFEPHNAAPRDDSIQHLVGSTWMALAVATVLLGVVAAVMFYYESRKVQYRA